MLSPLTDKTATSGAAGGALARKLTEPLDQLADGARGPERERQLQPVGRPLGDPALDLLGLLRRQQALAAPRRHPPAVEEAVLAPLAVALCQMLTVWRCTPTARAASAWVIPSRSIRNRARRRSASCAGRPRPRKSRASMARTWSPGRRMSGISSED